jgi:hypothetical protein
MDGRRREPLSEEAPSDDALDSEIEAAFAVDPTPSFVARTRARVEHERMRATGGLMRPLVWVGGVVAVVVAAIWLWPAGQPTLPSVALPDIVLAPLAVAPPPVAAPAAPGSAPQPETLVPVTARSEPTVREPAEAPAPDVIVAPEEARGFELLLAGLDQGVIDGSTLPGDWGRLDEDARVPIDVMPIEIVPLMPLARQEGERP